MIKATIPIGTQAFKVMFISYRTFSSYIVSWFSGCLNYFLDNLRVVYYMLRFENHLYETQDKLFDKSTLLLATKMNPPTTRMVGKMRKSPSIGGIWTKGVSLEGTPSQTSMEPENHPSKKENLPKHNFLGSMLVLGSVYLHHLPPKKPLVFCPNWIGLSDLSTHTHTWIRLS